VNASRIQDAVRSRRGVVTALVVAMGCVPVLAACATTFGAPLRHAVANLQAASVDVGTDLRIDGLIVALPNGSTADKGDVAYIQFNVVNSASQPDELLTASAKATGTTLPEESSNGTAAPSAGASGAPAELSDSPLPVGSTTVPAATAQSPGTARLSVALMSLTQPIAQGESVLVSLQFKNGGAVDDVLVPVQGSDNVGSSFLPSAPPSIPASETPLPESSAPESSAPASSAPASPTSSS
jgi:copper(I)-binding protein